MEVSLSVPEIRHDTSTEEGSRIGNVGIAFIVDTTGSRNGNRKYLSQSPVKQRHPQIIEKTPGGVTMIATTGVVEACEVSPSRDHGFQSKSPTRLARPKSPSKQMNARKNEPAAATRPDQKVSATKVKVQRSSNSNIKRENVKKAETRWSARIKIPLLRPAGAPRTKLPTRKPSASKRNPSAKTPRHKGGSKNDANTSKVMLGTGSPKLPEKCKTSSAGENADQLQRQVTVTRKELEQSNFPLQHISTPKSKSNLSPHSRREHSSLVVQSICIDTAKELLAARTTLRVFDPSPRKSRKGKDAQSQRKQDQPRQELTKITKAELQEWLDFANDQIDLANGRDEISCNSTLSTNDGFDILDDDSSSENVDDYDGFFVTMSQHEMTIQTQQELQPRRQRAERPVVKKIILGLPAAVEASESPVRKTKRPPSTHRIRQGPSTPRRRPGAQPAFHEVAEDAESKNIVKSHAKDIVPYSATKEDGETEMKNLQYLTEVACLMSQT